MMASLLAFPIALLNAVLEMAKTRIGFAALCCAGLILFYEGLPLGPLRWIPFVGPALESVVDGRVDRERRGAEQRLRLAYEAERQRQQAVADRARAEAQSAIDTAERELIDRQAADDARIAALEVALEEYRNEANQPDRDAGNKCPAPRRPSTRGLSERLNAVGR